MRYNVRKVGGYTVESDTGKKHGGRRAGAGRKSAKEAGLTPMQKHSVTLTSDDIAQLLELGGGYLSRGIREALRRLNQRENQ